MKTSLLWKRLLMGCLLLALLAGCATATPEPTATPVPPTDTPGPSTLEVINSFETLANDKNVEGTMELFAKNAVVEESFRLVVFDGVEKIKSLWRGYYRNSPPCEFREITVDGDTATFNWAELGAVSANLWPVVIEVKNGKITYMDFYEDATRVPIGEE